MTVYLIHFEAPICPDTKDGRRTQHYIGWASDGNLRRRLGAHATGRGARLTQVARERGIGWRLARTWPGGDRALERKLKRSNNRWRYCPICRPGTRHGLDVAGVVKMPFVTDAGVAEIRPVAFRRPRVRKPIAFVVSFEGSVR